MSVCGVLMVKNEVDVIATTVTHLLSQVDTVIVADNLSTDGTREILDSIHAVYQDRLLIRDDTEIGYWQSRKMTALALNAYALGHDWVVPCDADEIWKSTVVDETVGQALDGLHESYGKASAAVFNHYATALDDQEISNPMLRMEWRTEQPLGLPKTAVRLHPGVVIDAGNHNATGPKSAPNTIGGLLQVRHFPYRSPEQFVSKAITGSKAYAATDLPRGLGLHWREYGERIEELGEEAGGHDWFNRYFCYDDPINAGRAHDQQPDRGLAPLVHDPCFA